MPNNVIKTPRDEKLWNEAKAQADKEGKKGNYAYIQSIFQRMQHRTGGEKAALGKKPYPVKNPGKKRR